MKNSAELQDIGVSDWTVRNGNRSFCGKRNGEYTDQYR